MWEHHLLHLKWDNVICLPSTIEGWEDDLKKSSNGVGAEFLHLPADDGLNAAAEKLCWVALFNYLRERSLEGHPDLVEQHLWTCDSIAGHGQLLFPNLAVSQEP